MKHILSTHRHTNNEHQTRVPRIPSVLFFPYQTDNGASSTHPTVVVWSRQVLHIDNKIINYELINCKEFFYYLWFYNDHWCCPRSVPIITIKYCAAGYQKKKKIFFPVSSSENRPFLNLQTNPKLYYTSIYYMWTIKCNTLSKASGIYHTMS